MSLDHKWHGYADKDEDGASLVWEIFSWRNLEWSLGTFEKLTFFVSDTVREYLTQRKRSTQYEQQVLGWFLSLSDVDFEKVSSMTLGDGKILWSYKWVLQDLRSLNISLSNFWKLEWCEMIAIWDSPLVSWVSLKFQDGEIMHITPDQFQTFAQFWKGKNGEIYSGREMLPRNEKPKLSETVPMEIKVPNNEKELIQKVLSYFLEKQLSHQKNSQPTDTAFSEPTRNVLEQIEWMLNFVDIYKNEDGNYVLVTDSNQSITISYNVMRELTIKYYSENPQDSVVLKLISDMKRRVFDWWAKLNGL